MVSNLLNPSLILAFQKHFWLLFRMITFSTPIKLYSLHLKTAFTTVTFGLLSDSSSLFKAVSLKEKEENFLSFSNLSNLNLSIPWLNRPAAASPLLLREKIYVREVFKLICGIWTSRAAKSYMKGQREAKLIWMLFITRWGVGTEFLFSSWTVIFQFRICSPPSSKYWPLQWSHSAIEAIFQQFSRNILWKWQWNGDRINMLILEQLWNPTSHLFKVVQSEVWSHRDPRALSFQIHYWNSFESCVSSIYLCQKSKILRGLFKCK